MTTVSEIMDAITKSQDEQTRIILSFQLKVLSDITDRLDAFMANEAALRASVLNGHAAVHDEHHERVSLWIIEEDAAKRLVEEDQADQRRQLRAAKWRAIENMLAWVFRAAPVAILIWLGWLS